MQTKTLLVALAALSSVTDAAVTRRRSPFTSALQKRQFGGGFGGGGFGGGGFGGGNFGGNNNNNGGGNGDLELDPDVVQEGSQQDGNANAEDGQAASAT